MNDNVLRLGMIGMSAGNGHPYSWSAICNGYDQAAMEDCGFPVIPRYLEQQTWPDDRIAGVEVTHVWTQDRQRSEHIARAGLIANVCAHLTDMVGEVDGVLLARDDAENHPYYALPFLEAGIPIYIDKPVAHSVAGAKTLFDAQVHDSQLFTCSALRYAHELSLSDAERQRIGDIRHIHATVPKYWSTYAVHAIEPALLLIPERGRLVAAEPRRTRSTTSVTAQYGSGCELIVTAFHDAAAPISLRVFGATGWADLVFHNSFSAFRGALQAFVDGVRSKDRQISTEFTLDVVRIIQAGMTDA